MSWKRKAQITFALTLLIGIVGLQSFKLGQTSVDSAGTYYLDYPFGDASYYIGKFTNGFTYMIDVDTWQCVYYSSSSLSVINSAIGNLSSTGGKVVLAPEIYYLNGAIEYASNLTLCGSGFGTILYLNDAADTDVMRNPDSTSEVENLRVSSLKIDGNQDGQTDVALADLRSGINLTNVHQSQLDNLLIVQCKRFGIETHDSSGIQIVDSTFIEGGGDDDVSISDGSTGILLDSLVSLNHSSTFGTATERSSFEFEDGASNITVSNCQVLGSPITTHAGFSVKQHDNYPACRNIVIDGCFVEGTQYSFRVWREALALREAPQFITISDSIAVGYVHAGFHVRGAEYVTFDNVKALNGSDASTSGFRLNYSRFVTIKDSMALSNRNGIRLLEANNYTLIEGNTVTDNLYGITVNDDGGIGNFNTTIRNNVATNNEGALQLVGIQTLSNTDWSYIIGNYVENNVNDAITFVDTNIVVNGNLGYTTENRGAVVTCYNGTWIPHGLAGDPSTTGSITLSLRGATEYNATFILRVPTILQSNSTHFQLEFTAWETAGWTQVPVTVVEAQTVYWDAKYKP